VHQPVGAEIDVAQEREAGDRRGGEARILVDRSRQTIEGTQRTDAEDLRIETEGMRETPPPGS
jgi:hypothetical protein